MYEKKVEVMSKKEVDLLASKFPAGNDYICETAGFIPLEIKFKRFEQAGQIARLNASDFTSQDYREMYQSPDYDIYPDDDLDDIEEKMIALKNHINEVRQKVYQRSLKEKEVKKPEEKPEEKPAEKPAEK